MPSYTGLLDDPLYTGGGGTTTEVPNVYDVGIAGAGYMVDRLEGTWRHESIPLIRTQADSSTEPGEASVSPEDMWRRARQSWHRGAGQAHADRRDSDPARFRSSKGVDPFTKWQLCLLNSTDQKHSTVNTNLQLVPAGSRLYLVDGQTVQYVTTATAGTWSTTTLTGTPAVAVNGLASDGYNVWIGYGASGIYLSNTGIGTAASHVTGTVGGPLAYVKGRLMCANDASIYNVTGAGALPTALFTQANSAFRWVGFAEGLAAIYAAGWAGDKSLIYRIPLKPDASALDQPIVAGTLPDGEIVTSIGGYLGFIFVGTNKGWRFCTADGQGNLTIGALISTTTSVLAWEGQGSFMWFGWTNYDGTSTGLGRADLREVTDPQLLAIAYASDLMTTGQGAVQTVVTFGDVRYYGVSGVGYYGEDVTAKVASGTLDTGSITFDVPDPKVLLQMQVRFDATTFGGTYECSYALDGATSFTSMGTLADTATDLTGKTFSFGSSGTRAEAVEFRHSFTRSSGTPTLGPCLMRWSLRAEPATLTANRIIVPLVIAPTIRDATDNNYTMDVDKEISNFRAMRSAGTVVNYQEGEVAYPVMVKDLEWKPLGYADGRQSLVGTLTVILKHITTTS